MEVAIAREIGPNSSSELSVSTDTGGGRGAGTSDAEVIEFYAKSESAWPSGELVVSILGEATELNVVVPVEPSLT